MRIEVKVPQLPESVTEATLVNWHKKPGEQVKRDENLIDVETGTVIEFQDEKLEELKREIAARLGYEIVEDMLELYGRKKQRS